MVGREYVPSLISTKAVIHDLNAGSFSLMPWIEMNLDDKINIWPIYYLFFPE